ncbi:MAG: hypothetical protein HZB50_13825 [Chloroflexi bacterium]|nr:hypothetical protein [Chloroflexota bacterium]
MTFPSALLALMIALLFGALFCAIRGRNGWWLLYYFGLSAAGFAVGLMIGWHRWVFLPLGPINLGMGIIGSALFLGIGDWLGRIQKTGKKGK